MEDRRGTYVNEDEERATPATLTAPMRQLLTWVAEETRTYTDVMDAWRSSCPRLSIWEDALDDRLIQEERCAGTGRNLVTLTARGRAALEAATVTTAR